MHLVADLQCSANKLFFELLAHIGLFEDPDEIEMMNFNLSLFPMTYVLPLMFGILIHQNDNQQILP